ncbi:uncharacterized protein LOC144579065 [Callithrix jacchus]
MNTGDRRTRGVSSHESPTVRGAEAARKRCRRLGSQGPPSRAEAGRSGTGGRRNREIAPWPLEPGSPRRNRSLALSADSAGLFPSPSPHCQAETGAGCTRRGRKPGRGRPAPAPLPDPRPGPDAPGLTRGLAPRQVVLLAERPRPTARSGDAQLSRRPALPFCEPSGAGASSGSQGPPHKRRQPGERPGEGRARGAGLARGRAGSAHGGDGPARGPIGGRNRPEGRAPPGGLAAGVGIPLFCASLSPAPGDYGAEAGWATSWTRC